MPIYLVDLSRPSHGTVSYIHTETPGLIAGCRVGSTSLKFLLNTINYFINYLETWSQVSDNGFLWFALSPFCSYG